MADYRLRNHYNRELKKIEQNCLGTGQFGPFKSPKLDIIYGHFKAKEQNKRIIQHYSRLFINSDNLCTFHLYYSVVNPENSQLINADSEFPIFKTIHNTNPFIELKDGYSRLAHIFKNLTRSSSHYYKIIREHQECTKNGLDLHNHDNLIILATKNLTIAQVNHLIRRSYKHSPLIKTQKLQNQSDFNAVVNYMNETKSQLPYCKHSIKGAYQVKDLNKMKEINQIAFLKGILLSSKGVTLSHTANAKNVIKHLTKSQSQSTRSLPAPINHFDTIKKISDPIKLLITTTDALNSLSQKLTPEVRIGVPAPIKKSAQMTELTTIRTRTKIKNMNSLGNNKNYATYLNYRKYIVTKICTNYLINILSNILQSRSSGIPP